MALILYDSSNIIKDAEIDQENITENMAQLISSVYAPLYIFYSAYNYFILQYDVIKNFRECKKFAFTFSQYPRLFLGNVRAEIQFDDINLTISPNIWVSCKSLINEELNYVVEYYIYTVKKLPHTIFFRIKNNEKLYTSKLKHFIDSILNYGLNIEQVKEVKNVIEDITDSDIILTEVTNITNVTDITDITEVTNVTKAIIPYKEYIFIPQITAKNSIMFTCLVCTGYFVYQHFH